MVQLSNDVATRLRAHLPPQLQPNKQEITECPVAQGLLTKWRESTFFASLSPTALCAPTGRNGRLRHCKCVVSGRWVGGWVTNTPRRRTREPTNWYLGWAPPSPPLHPAPPPPPHPPKYLGPLLGISERQHGKVPLIGLGGGSFPPK